jgi:hypothetical protein
LLLSGKELVDKDEKNTQTHTPSIKGYRKTKAKCVWWVSVGVRKSHGLKCFCGFQWRNNKKTDFSDENKKKSKIEFRTINKATTTRPFGVSEETLPLDTNTSTFRKNSFSTTK